MRLNGGRALMEILRIEGVEYVFGLPGATEARFMHALEEYPDIQFRLGLHELVAAGMAEGYARASGRPAVLHLHTLTGLAAAMPLLSNACTGGVPLIITAGQQDSRLLASEPALTGDLVKLASHFSKWGYEIIHSADIPTIFRRAFRAAQHPPSGPVFISLPQDVLENEIDFSYFRSSPSYQALHPQPEAVQLAAGSILKSKKPLLIVEDGISKSAALAEIVQLAELIAAPVYQPWMSDVNFPVGHALYAGDLSESSAKTCAALAGADLILAVGVDLFSQVLYLEKPLMPPGIPLIQIDSDARQIGKNFPVTVGIEGDIKLALQDLVCALEGRADEDYRHAAQARFQAAEAEKARSDAFLVQKTQREWDQTPLATSRFMQELKETLPAGAIVVDDCWSASAALRQTLAFSRPSSYLRGRNGGSIGFGLPGALGVKLGAPQEPVVCVSGDGSALWSIQSLWSAARYQIPVTFIILANGCYQMVRNARVNVLGEQARERVLGTDLCGPQADFCRLAEGLGIAARKVSKPADLKKSLQEAFALNRPNLVEVQIESVVL